MDSSKAPTCRISPLMTQETLHSTLVVRSTEVWRDLGEIENESA